MRAFHGKPYRQNDDSDRSEKKQIFEEICAQQDLTPSQVVRKLIHQYIIEHAGSRELPEWLTGYAAKVVNRPL